MLGECAKRGFAKQGFAGGGQFLDRRAGIGFSISVLLMQGYSDSSVHSHRRKFPLTRPIFIKKHKFSATGAGIILMAVITLRCFENFYK